MSVRVTILPPTPRAGVIWLVDHAAVTPERRPLMEKLMLPLNEPAVTAPKLTVAKPPGAKATRFDAAVMASVGGAVTVRA